MSYEYDKYVTNIHNLKNKLDEFGVAIIPNVLNDYECKKINDGIWDFFEHISHNWNGDLTPISRNDENTWKGIYELYPLHSQLFKGIHSSHAQVSWDVRQNSKIVDIFSNLWNCNNEDLLVSFDSFSFCLPPEITKKGWEGKSWFHTDQSYTRNDFECIQSWVTGNDVNEGDSTLAIMEGSHKFHKEFGEKFKVTNENDWYKLNSIEEKFYIEKNCEYKKIKCPKGSLVFWDSRTIHYGCGPMRNRQVPNLRSVIYVCYMPKSSCSVKYLEKKKNLFYKKRTTNHWPCRPITVSEKPNTFGGKFPEILEVPEPILSVLGRSLAGIL